MAKRESPKPQPETETPRYLDGEPINFSAAALDALDWLRFWDQYAATSLGYSEWHVTRRRLRSCIGGLERHIPKDEPIFTETEEG